jgi:cell division protein FtsA
VPIGGDHFTSDIAVGLRMPIPEAEKLKRRCGCALSSLVGDDDMMDVASVGGRAPRTMARRILSEVLQPRAEELCHLVWDEIHRAGYEKALNSGIVLTGGAANLEGMTEIAEQIFDLPLRHGTPAGSGSLADHISNPSFATAMGLVQYAQRQRAQDSHAASRGGIGRLTDLVKGVFKEFL